MPFGISLPLHFRSTIIQGPISGQHVIVLHGNTLAASSTQFPQNNAVFLTYLLPTNQSASLKQNHANKTKRIIKATSSGYSRRAKNSLYRVSNTEHKQSVFHLNEEIHHSWTRTEDNRKKRRRATCNRKVNSFSSSVLKD